MSSAEGSIIGVGGGGSGGGAPPAAGYLAMEVENNNLRRSAETLAAQDEIALLEARLAKLREENEDRATTASLRFQGNAADWEELSHEKKWKKDNVLAILSCTENNGALPALLQESNDGWFFEYDDEDEEDEEEENNSGRIPDDIRLDNDIFQARVHRDDFQMHHVEVAPRSPLVIREIPVEINDASRDELTKKCPELFYWWSRKGENVGWVQNCAPRLKLFLASVKDPLLIRPTLTKSILRSEIFDSELILLAVKKSTQALMVLPKKLRDDEAFALKVAAALGAPPEGRVIRSCCNLLQYFSECVRNSREVATAFVRLHGTSYGNVPLSVRKIDSKLARIACRTYPQVLWQSVPGLIEKTLTKDKSFMLDLFQTCKERRVGHPMLWRLLSPQLKRDRDLAVEALASECAAVDDLPFTWKTDRKFWLQALGKNCFLWHSTLPAHFREDCEFAKELSAFAPIFGELLESFPCLAFESHMWETFLKSDLSFFSVDDSLHSSLEEWTPDWMYGDKKLMLLAIAQGFHMFEALREPLDVDREIRHAAVSKCGVHALFHMSRDAIRLYPDLCAGALRVSSPVDSDVLEELFEDVLGPFFGDIWQNPQFLSAWFEAGGFSHDGIPGDAWQNREILSSWFDAGGPWHDDIPESCKQDREMMLIAAKHDHSTEVFSEYASAELRSDKAYMLSALEASNGRLYSSLSQLQKTDYDFLLTAFALYEQVGKEFRITNRDIIKFAARVRSRLELHAIFQKLVLCGMSVSTSGSHLRLLDRGEETLTAFKKNLSAFLDVPFGKDLRLLRQASKNLACWGF